MISSNSKKWITLLALCVILFTSGLKLSASLSDEIGIIHTADEPVRIVRSATSVRAGQWYMGSAFDINMFIGIHPPGDWFYRTFMLKIASFFDTNLSQAIIDSQIIAIFTFTALLIIAYFQIAFLINPLAGLFTVLSILMSLQIGVISLRAIGENTALLPFTLFLIFLVRAIKFQDKFDKNILISGIFLLMASFVRSEVILLLPIMCLILLFRYSLKSSIIFGAIASSYTVAKIIYCKIYIPSAVQYTDAYKVWSYGSYNLMQFIKTDFIAKHLRFDYPLTIFFPLMIFIIYFILRLPKSNKKIVEIILFPSIGMFLIITSASLMGFTHRSPSNLTFPLFGLYFVFGLVLYDLLDLLDLVKPKLKVYILSVLFILCPISAGYTTAKVVEDGKKIIPTEFVSVKNWLRQNISTSDGLLMDRLYYWDWYIMAGIGDLYTPQNICTYGMCEIKNFPKYGVIKKEVLAFSPQFNDEAGWSNANASVFLSEHTNPFLVLLDKPSAIKMGARLPKYCSYSQLWPYNSDALIFHFPGDDVKYRLELLTKFKDVGIYRVAERIKIQ